MHVLTLIAPPATALTYASLRRIAAVLEADHAAWLDPEQAADLVFAVPPDRAAVHSALEDAAIDAIAQPLAGRAKRLLVADMDSTIVTTETLDELAVHAGLGASIAAITRRSMNGEIDFGAALRERVLLLRGLKVTALQRTWESTEVTPGAHALVATMRAHGARCALVSGGFSFFTARVAALLGFDDHRANGLIDDGAALTGELAEPILDRKAKEAALRAYASVDGLSLAQTMTVGDGANDLDMLRAAGIGIAYHAKAIVARDSEARVDHCDLRALLFVQGYQPTASSLIWQQAATT